MRTPSLPRRVEPALVTSLPLGDLDRRRRFYLVTMTVRTLCLLLAVVVPSGPWTALLLAGAVVLPAVAVVGANSPRRPPSPTLLPRQRPALP